MPEKPDNPNISFLCDDEWFSDKIEFERLRGGKLKIEVAEDCNRTGSDEDYSVEFVLNKAQAKELLAFLTEVLKK